MIVGHGTPPIGEDSILPSPLLCQFLVNWLGYQPTWFTGLGTTPAPHRFYISASHKLVKRIADSFHRRVCRWLGADKREKRAWENQARFKLDGQNGAGPDASSALEAAEPEATVSGSGSPRSSLRTT